MKVVGDGGGITKTKLHLIDIGSKMSAHVRTRRTAFLKMKKCRHYREVAATLSELSIVARTSKT